MADQTPPAPNRNNYNCLVQNIQAGAAKDFPGSTVKSTFSELGIVRADVVNPQGAVGSITVDDLGVEASAPGAVLSSYDGKPSQLLPNVPGSSPNPPAASMDTANKLMDIGRKAKLNANTCKWPGV